MLNRLHFIFLKRYQNVKPVAANDPASMWLTQSGNLLEETQDDALRYGLRVALSNFFEAMIWRNQVYSQRK